jgi:hypothetical protein
MTLAVFIPSILLCFFLVFILQNNANQDYSSVESTNKTTKKIANIDDGNGLYDENERKTEEIDKENIEYKKEYEKENEFLSKIQKNHYVYEDEQWSSDIHSKISSPTSFQNLVEQGSILMDLNREIDYGPASIYHYVQSYEWNEIHTFNNENWEFENDFRDDLLTDLFLDDDWKQYYSNLIQFRNKSREFQRCLVAKKEEGNETFWQERDGNYMTHLSKVVHYLSFNSFIQRVQSMEKNETIYFFPPPLAFLHCYTEDLVVEHMRSIKVLEIYRSDVNQQVCYQAWLWIDMIWNIKDSQIKNEMDATKSSLDPKLPWDLHVIHFSKTSTLIPFFMTIVYSFQKETRKNESSLEELFCIYAVFDVNSFSYELLNPEKQVLNKKRLRYITGSQFIIHEICTRSCYLAKYIVSVDNGSVLGEVDLDPALIDRYKNIRIKEIDYESSLSLVLEYVLKRRELFHVDHF